MQLICRCLFWVIFLSACQPTQQTIQTAIARTQSAWTPTAPFLPSTAVPGITRQEWRVDPIANAVMVVTEAEIDPSFDAAILEKARGLDITPPFEYETYALPPSISFNDLAGYYTFILEKRGFDVAYSGFVEEKKIGLLVFKKSPMSIYVEFWDQPRDYDGKLVMVIYKNF